MVLFLRERVFSSYSGIFLKLCHYLELIKNGFELKHTIKSPDPYLPEHQQSSILNPSFLQKDVSGQNHGFYQLLFLNTSFHVFLHCLVTLFCMTVLVYIVTYAYFQIPRHLSNVSENPNLLHPVLIYTDEHHQMPAVRLVNRTVSEE